MSEISSDMTAYGMSLDVDVSTQKGECTTNTRFFYKKIRLVCLPMQSYARQLTILTNRTLAPGVCSALIPQEMIISSPQKGCLS
jgi:hypothetical protein